MDDVPKVNGVTRDCSTNSEILIQIDRIAYVTAGGKRPSSG